MKHCILRLLLLLACQCWALCLQWQTVFAQDIHGEHVFQCERSTNSNYICYDINLQPDGKLNLKEPLKSYWVLDEETRTEGLTFLDRKMAFGIKVLSRGDNEASVHMTAYKDLVIRICQRKGKWVGLVEVNGHEMVLQKIFAQMKPPMGIRCEYVNIHGTGLNTGEKRIERITP